MALEAGKSAEAAVKVETANTAASMKSGALPVFATPAMCALMEEAACAAVNGDLAEGEGTVGIALAISHDRATPLGETVTATAVLTAVEGRKLSFTVEARDSRGLIGKGTHQRFIISNEKFMRKLQ